MQPVTFVLPISRPENTDYLHDQIKQIIDTHSNTFHIITIIDNPQLRLNWDFVNHTKIYMDENHPGEANAYARRIRIAEMMNKARQHANNDGYTIIIEDDTVLPEDWFEHLHNYANYYKEAGIISGVQAGRWAAPMLGVWKTDNIDDPTLWETLPLSSGDLQPVDATGLYCCILPTRLFRETPFRVTAQGADVNFGLDLRRKGYQNYVDWKLLCGHKTSTKTIWPTKETPTIKYVKDADSPGGWKLIP